MSARTSTRWQYGSAKPSSSVATASWSLATGYAAIAFSLLYIASDVVELAQGGFSTAQLVMTLVAEAAVPFIVMGLYAVQRPQIGRLGFGGAIAYGYSYVFFTGTVMYALANSTPDFETLSDDLGVLMLAHGAVMLLAGIAFGAAIIRARVLPAWTGATLIAGVILVAATSGTAPAFETAAAVVRAGAFAAMGAVLVSRMSRRSS